MRKGFFITNIISGFFTLISIFWLVYNLSFSDICESKCCILSRLHLLMKDMQY